MNYSELFNEYWDHKGQYLGLNNPERTRKDISRRLANCKSVIDIDNYICMLRSRKETNRKIMVEFFDYLEETTGQKINSVLYKKKFYDYPFERQLEIAKFLHRPRTAAEIEERFDIDSRTRRKDLNALEDGIEVLGSTIRVEKTREGRRDYYKTTVHPIFLPLNLTEVYALTVYLDQAIDDQDPNKRIIQNLTNRVKAQLSDYAYEKLFPNKKRSSFANDYLNDEELARQREGVLMYLLKSGRKCRFFWNDQEYNGTFSYDGEYKICLEDGSLLPADINEIEFIIDSLEYK